MGTTAAIAAVISAGTAVYTATRPIPKPPTPPSLKKAAGISTVRHQNTPNIGALAAMSKAGSSTLLDSGSGAGGGSLLGG